MKKLTKRLQDQLTDIRAADDYRMGRTDQTASMQRASKTLQAAAQRAAAVDAVTQRLLAPPGGAKSSHDDFVVPAVGRRAGRGNSLGQPFSTVRQSPLQIAGGFCGSSVTVSMTVSSSGARSHSGSQSLRSVRFLKVEFR